MSVKTIGKLLFQLSILISVNKISYLIVDHLHIPVPGSVMGMVFLFILLWSGIIKLGWVEEMSGFLIKHLSFFFIPISVGLMTLGNVFVQKGFAILMVLSISGAIGIIFSGRTAQALIRKREGVHQNEHHHSA